MIVGENRWEERSSAMADPQIRAWLAARALAQLSVYGHSVPSIRWEADGQEASGTCTRCGDGVLLY